MRVKISPGGRSFEAAAGQSLLDAALGASLNLAHSCKSGNCGSCRARLLAGAIDYPNGMPLGLSDGEVAEGYVLLCQARARGDVTIEPIEIAAPEDMSIKRLPARIERAVAWSHDVMGLYLRLPAAEPLQFRAGQYLDIMLPGGRRRSFSMASAPGEPGLIELHVRRVAGGEFSERLFQDDPRKTLLSIEAPLGQFSYRDRTDAAPLLLVGGGTGLAPLLSIMRHVIGHGIERDVALYWGVRSEEDMYAQPVITELGARFPRLRYVPVLSEPGAAWGGRRGMVHQAVIEDGCDLVRHDVYAAGPPAMIAAVRREFTARGADPQRLFFDSFDYAPDSAARQAPSAANKS